MGIIIDAIVNGVAAPTELNNIINSHHAKETQAGWENDSNAADKLRALNPHNIEIEEVRATTKTTNSLSDALATVNNELSKITVHLNRMRELANQATDTDLDSEIRAQLDADFSEYFSQIDTVAQEANFNGFNLLDGTLSDGLSISIGDTPVANYNIAVTDMHADKLFSQQESLLASHGVAQETMERIEDLLFKQSNKEAEIKKVQSKLKSTLSNLGSRYEELNKSEAQPLDPAKITEFISYTRSVMMAQAANTMFAQANVLPLAAMKLLGY